MTSIVQTLQQLRRADPDRVLVIARDQPYTRAQVDDMSTRIAMNLLATGLAPGDRVALHLANGIEIVALYYGCLKAGLIALPINTRLKGPEIEYVVTHAGARAYIGQPDLFVEADAPTAHLALRFLIGGDPRGVQSFATLIGDAAHVALPETPLDAPAVVLYTSGTTARPKGVTHTGHSLAAMTECSADVFFVEGDKVAISLPLVHIAALLGLLTAIRLETVPVVLPFEPNAVLDAVEKHGISIMTSMPALYRMLAETQAVKPRKVSTLRALFVGGDSAPEALHQQCEAVLGAKLVECYGMTEGVPLTFNTLETRRAGSLGKVIPQGEIRLVDDKGREVALGEVGEVTARAPLVFSGYWNDPVSTAATLKDGWLRTGDLAWKDKDGFYWFAGRSKELIIRGGSNVSPQEVEETLYQHPAVAEVAVVGKPDDQWGEIIVAFVALKPGMSLTADELTTFASERIAKYKVPEAIVFEATLPKGPTGKVARRPLRERLTQEVRQ